jgi:hypothetical protein
VLCRFNRYSRLISISCDSPRFDIYECIDRYENCFKRKKTANFDNDDIMLAYSYVSSSFKAGHRSLQFLAISLDLRLLASSSCQSSCANRHYTWPEGVLHYVYLAVSTPELVYSSICIPMFKDYK